MIDSFEGMNMIIAQGKDVLRHDFHTLSLQSACGISTKVEILEIAAHKGVETVNIIKLRKTLQSFQIFPLHFNFYFFILLTIQFIVNQK